MNQFQLVSVAICTYNGEEYIEEQLTSIVNQSYPNIEIILCDDCSTDRTVAIVKKLNIKNLTLIENTNNLGFIKNFEKALGYCSGEYIALSDQDDIWDLRKIELQISAIGDNLLIYADSEFVDFKGGSLHQKISDKYNFVRGSNIFAFTFTNCVSGHNIFIKRNLLNYCLPFPKDVFHDVWISFVASVIGKIDYIDLPLVKYRQHHKSITTSIVYNSKKTDLRYRNKYNAFKQTINRLSHFSKFQFLNEKDKIKMLYLNNLFLNKFNNVFNFRLLFFLIRNRIALYSIFNKSSFKIIFQIFKESINLKSTSRKLKKFYDGE